LIGGEAVVCSTSNQGNNCLELHTYMQNHITTFDTSVFEVVNGQINLTKICQHFHKRLDVWLKTKQTKAFLASYSVLTPNGGITVNIGNNGKEQGTFGNRQVALKLAQWISPEFEVFCIQKLDELFQTGKTELNPKQINRKELALMVIAQEEELEKLALENTKLATRSLEVTTQKEYKWKKQELKDDMGRTINWYVGRKFYTNNWKTAHDKAKKAYRINTGVDLPNKIDLASLEMKKSYLEWLSKYEA
jgi:hypothetical protein